MLKEELTSLLYSLFQKIVHFMKLVLCCYQNKTKTVPKKKKKKRGLKINIL